MILRRLVSVIFGSLVGIRNRLYLGGVIKRVDAGKKVISVGNLSMGGTGKTPLVLMLARFVSASGYNTAVIEKGYKSKLRFNELVLAEKGLDTVSSILIGDEASLIWENIPESTRLAVGGNKTQCAINIVDKWPDTEYIIVDDGFQHLKLKRNVDILLLDAETGFSDSLFPLGRLREPYGAMNRADVVVFTKAGRLTDDAKKTLVYEAQSFNPDVKIFFSSLDLRTGVSLETKRILPVSGICNNRHFLAALKEAGARFSSHVSYPDHYNYTGNDVRNMRMLKNETGSDYIVVTSKDWMKLRHM
ncbi:MAG: tetraacyldisaccharide 4'-kinase, partial [Oligoflexia bacterium]|nr:tetraacyldisaccharide 4'-kinase [Oligoflexia bacterium]